MHACTYVFRETGGVDSGNDSSKRPKERKAAQPHAKGLPFVHMRSIKVDSCLRSHSVVPNQLIFLGELAEGQECT